MTYVKNGRIKGERYVSMSGAAARTGEVKVKMVKTV